MDLAWRQVPSMTERITKPIFQKQHYDAIAELIGEKIVYGFMDGTDYSIIEAFAEMFAQDNPATFDKDRLEMQCMKHIVGGRAAKKATVGVSNTARG